MFPPNLQKNIRELDRQISLLETECEHMENEKENSVLCKPISKTSLKEPPTKVVASNPCTSSYPTKTLPTVTPKVTPASLALNKTLKDQSIGENEPNQFLNYSKRPPPKKENVEDDGKSRGNFRELFPNHHEKATSTTGDSEGPKFNTAFECKKLCKRPIGAIMEVSESSDEMSFPQEKNNSEKLNFSPEMLKCGLMKRQNVPKKQQEKQNSKKSLEDLDSSFSKSQSDSKLSSDEEIKREYGKPENKSDKWDTKRPFTSPGKISAKRRYRSVRTKKKSDDIPFDFNVAKAISENEIQCLFWNDEREKAKFLVDLNDSVRTLHLLINELKTKPTREKKNDVLNDMKNTLMKINGIRSIGALHNPLNGSVSLKGNDLALQENEETVLNLKKALFAVKKFCQELNEEKSVLNDELAAKNQTIANLKKKEKEYLTVISNLKFSLEKLKAKVDEETHLKRDLLVVKTKLREESKVVEALKKSHKKMQELIQHHVLENDKLRAEMKLTKLETEKFNVLLAAKEVEINKYKQEIDSFQRRITQQLNLLRSKATENGVDHALKAINNTQILRADMESFPSDTTLDGEISTYTFDLIETTLSQTNEICQSSTKLVESSPINHESDSPNQYNHNTEVETNTRGTECNWYKPESLESAIKNEQYNLGLRKVLSSSKFLRNSISEMLQEMRAESAEMWLSPPDSSNISHCTTNSSCKENVLECDQKN